MSTPPEPTQEPQTQPDPVAPETGETEAKFWARLKAEVKGQVDSALDARDKKDAANRPPGEQRTGRNTFFDMVADFMGGPFKGPQK